LRELALHILDIAENSVAARARNINITVDENSASDRLRISIQDDGKGMDEKMVSLVTNPFFTSRTTRKVGLGLPLLKEAAEACNGYLNISSEPGKGTLVTVEFQLSHIDRMPLGSLNDTFFSLFIAFPEIHWVFKYLRNGDGFYFDDVEMKKELQGVSLTEPPVLSFFRDLFENGINNITEKLMKV
jgi:anti-sigma regulatory factor (Ser/Thr protein kinase)